MKPAIPLLLGAAFFASCAGQPRFQQDPQHHVLKGAGGTTRTVGGVEFWQRGAPSKKYVVLGYVDDYWRGDDLDEFDLKHLAPVVKKYGGDAAVVIHGDEPAPGLTRERDETGPMVLRLQVIKFP